MLSPSLQTFTIQNHLTNVWWRWPIDLYRSITTESCHRMCRDLLARSPNSLLPTSHVGFHGYYCMFTRRWNISDPSASLGITTTSLHSCLLTRPRETPHHCPSTQRDLWHQVTFDTRWPIALDVVVISKIWGQIMLLVLVCVLDLRFSHPMVYKGEYFVINLVLQLLETFVILAIVAKQSICRTKENIWNVSCYITVDSDVC